MRGYLINVAVAVTAMMILLKAAKSELIVKNNICLAGVATALAVGCFIFNSHTMVLWVLLVMQSYTDITEQHLYLMMPRLLAVIEVAYCLINKTYMVLPIYTLIYPTVLIVLVSLLLNAYADGDTELFLILMLHIYNQGISPGGYMIDYLLTACSVFAVYMIIKNVIRMIKHQATVWKGAFAPAMTLGFLIVSFNNLMH